MIAEKYKNTLFPVIKPLYSYNNRILCCVYKNTVTHTIQYSWLWGEGFWAVFLGPVWCDTHRVSRAGYVFRTKADMEFLDGTLVSDTRNTLGSLHVWFWINFRWLCVQTPYTVVKVSGASPEIQLSDLALRIYDHQSLHGITLPQKTKRNPTKQTNKNLWSRPSNREGNRKILQPTHGPDGERDHCPYVFFIP